MTNQDDASADEPTDKYVRRQPAQLEIERLPAAVGPAYVSLLVTAEEPETLVYGIRRLYQEGLERECEPLWDRLMFLLRDLLAARAFKWDAHLREELIQLTTLELLERILDLSEKERFLEYNLLRVLSVVMSNAARTLQRQRGEWEKKAIERPSSYDEMLDDGLLESSLSSGGMSVEDSVLDSIAVEDILSHLPDKIGRAVLLSEAGFQIESKDPTKPGISDILQVSPRTVQNYLKEARRLLETYQLAHLDS